MQFDMKSGIKMNCWWWGLEQHDMQKSPQDLKTQGDCLFYLDIFIHEGIVKSSYKPFVVSCSPWGRASTLLGCFSILEKHINLFLKRLTWSLSSPKPTSNLNKTGVCSTQIQRCTVVAFVPEFYRMQAPGNYAPASWKLRLAFLFRAL